MPPPNYVITLIESKSMQGRCFLILQNTVNIVHCLSFTHCIYYTFNRCKVWHWGIRLETCLTSWDRIWWGGVGRWSKGYRVRKTARSFLTFLRSFWEWELQGNFLGREAISQQADQEMGLKHPKKALFFIHLYTKWSQLSVLEKEASGRCTHRDVSARHYHNSGPRPSVWLLPVSPAVHCPPNYWLPKGKKNRI